MISNRMILAICCAVLLSGCAVIYCYDNNDYSASITIDGDHFDYEISGFMPCEYAWRVYSNTEVLDKMYFYLDERYESMNEFDGQKIFAEDMMRVLKSRGFDNVKTIDADELKDLVLDPSAAAGSGIFFNCGTLPDTVSDHMDDWFANGGTVFWAGEEYGMYIAHTDGYDEITEGRPFQGSVNDDTDQNIKEISEFGKATGFSLKDCCGFGLKKDYPGSLCLSTCSDDYSSASVLGYNGGRIYIFGDSLNGTVLCNHTALAEIIICGITENTIIEANEEFHKGYGSVSGTIDLTLSSGNVVIVSIGKPYSSWAKSFIVP